jgi:hypothetical protein
VDLIVATPEQLDRNVAEPDCSCTHIVGPQHSGVRLSPCGFRRRQGRRLRRPCASEDEVKSVVVGGIVKAEGLGDGLMHRKSTLAKLCLTMPPGALLALGWS